MPIPGLTLPDDTLFDGLNMVMVAYLLLVFFPHWRHTPALTMAIVSVYSVMYGLLLTHRLFIATEPLPEIAFDRLSAIVALFADRATLFAGWTHYIAFDLFVARFIVLDSQLHRMPHLLVIWAVPLTLFAGTVGLTAYLALRTVWPSVHTLCHVWERVALPESRLNEIDSTRSPGRTSH